MSWSCTRPFGFASLSVRITLLKSQQHKLVYDKARQLWSITSDKSFSLKELFLLNLIFLIPEQYYWGMDHLYQGKQGPNWRANVCRNFFVSWVFSTWQYTWLGFSLKKLILVAPCFGQSWLHVRMEFVQWPHMSRSFSIWFFTTSSQCNPSGSRSKRQGTENTKYWM